MLSYLTRHYVQECCQPCDLLHKSWSIHESILPIDVKLNPSVIELVKVILLSSRETPLGAAEPEVKGRSSRNLLY